jgi:hypothetical protein
MTQEELQKMLDEIPQKNFAKLSDKQLEGIEALKSHPNYILFKKKAGKSSSKKQWGDNKELMLERSKNGGKKCYEDEKGLYKLSKEQLSENGKKGYENGLGKLSKEEIGKILEKANNKRLENRKFTKEEIDYMRKNFKPYDKEFGVVPLSKKFNINESSMRNIIKNKYYKDITTDDK